MAKNKRKSINTIAKKVDKCGSCNIDVDSESEDPAFQCDNCNKWIHSACTGLKGNVLSNLLADESAPYFCKPCDSKKKAAKSSSSSSMNLTSQFSHSQFQKIMSRFDDMADIKNDTAEIKKTVEFLSEMINDTNKKCDKLDINMKKLENENAELKRMVNLQNIRLNSLENVKLKSQCFMRKPTLGFNRDNVVVDLIQVVNACGVELAAGDIKSSSVQQKMTNGEMTVIKIEFKDEEKKFQVMKNKSKLKELTQFKDVSLFDVLSRSSADLFKHAKLLKECGFKFIYHHSGKIFAKKSEQTEPIQISNKSKVDELLRGYTAGNLASNGNK